MSVRLAALDGKVRTELKASDIQAFLTECGESKLVVGVAVAQDDGKCFLLYHFNHAALILGQPAVVDRGSKLEC